MVNTKGALEVNCATQEGGSVRVEILDEAGKVLPGYERENCIPLSGDSLRQTVAWQMKAVKGISKITATLPSEPAGIRIRFIQKKAALYSFNCVAAHSIPK
jgi:hypothetical protein